jgi:hypothetical protein
MRRDQKRKDRGLKRNALIGAAVAAIAAGGVIVVVPAATGQGTHPSHRRARPAQLHAGHRGAHEHRHGHGHGHGGIAVAASYLGLTTVQLRSDLRSGRTLAQIAETTSGRSTSGLLDALLSAKTATFATSGTLSAAKLLRLRTRLTAKVERVSTAPAGANLSAAASYLGVGTAQLHRELRSGTTLAQIASATPGSSPAGLIAALASAGKSRLAAAAASGALTPKREKALLSALPRRVTNEVGRLPHKGASAPRG